MANVQVQLCGLIFDILLIVFVMRHESVGLYSERLFKISLLVYTCCICLDILSVFAIIYEGSVFPTWATVAACKIYLVLLISSAYFGFIYTFSDIVHLRESRPFKYGVSIFALFGSILALALPIYYYYDGKTVLYSYGPATQVTFIFAPIFIISSIVITYLYKSLMNVHKRRAIRLWMLLEILAAVIQFVFPQLLLVGFGSSLGLFILYAVLENPEAYLDKTTGCFSLDTLNSYLNQEYSELKKFSSIIVCLPNNYKLNEEDEKGVLLEVAEFLNAFAGSKLFRLHGNDFALIYDSKDRHEMDEIESAVNLDVIKNRFESEWNGSFFIKAGFLYVPNGNIVSSADEFVELYTKYRDSFTDSKQTRLLDKESGEAIKEFRQMVVEIKNALSDDRIEVYYQPIYSLSTEKFVSAEALARLRSIDGRIIMPGRFIPVAEEAGLIEQVGERVFEKACSCISNNHLKEKGVEYIEVNLSVAQCDNPFLHRTYQNIIFKNHINPKEVNLEITESSSLIHRNILLENMDRLINLGCAFSLDDFGTGESNLNYIVDMPVNIVKFDKTMVQDYFNNEKAKVVMTSTVNMIKELGLKVVAEGVETAEQLEGMRNLGVDYIQGFYFSKPLPLNEYIQFIEKHNGGRL
jgi:FOG: EAL domain